MKVLMKQSVHLDGKDYGLGVQDMPESVKDHSYFKSLLKCGLAVIKDEAAKNMENPHPLDEPKLPIAEDPIEEEEVLIEDGAEKEVKKPKAPKKSKKEA